MQERQFLRIKTNNPELSAELLLCGSHQELFELRGANYMVEACNRYMGASGPGTEVDLCRVIKAEWRGPEDGLPPVGVMVEVAEGPAVWVDGDEWIGKHVKVQALFKNDIGQDVAAVSVPDGRCQCFIVECLRPIRTAEQLAAEEREAGISALVDLMDGAGYRSAAERLYKAGVRAPEVK